MVTKMFQRMAKKRSAQSMSASTGKITITRLVSRRQWKLLDELLRENTSIPIDDTVNRPITSDLLVHFVCRFQAPTSIVEIVANTYPESCQCTDALGRFPIHIACAWGASADTIRFLIHEYPVAASIQDNDGKAPIHHLCQSFVINYDHVSMPVADCMLAVVDMLKAAAPKSFNLEDNDDMNAIEYALESETNIKVVKAIQKACRDDWRWRKRQSDASHEALKEDLHRIQLDLRSQHLSCSDNLSILDSSTSSKSKCEIDSTVPINATLKVKMHAARMA